MHYSLESEVGWGGRNLGELWSVKRFLLENSRIGYIGYSDNGFNELDQRVPTGHNLIIFVFEVLNSYLLHIRSLI